MAQVCGFEGRDIMFSSNNTPSGEFKFANELEGIINIDDITHIDFVEAECGKLPKTMSCRVNPGGVFTLSNKIMDNPGDAKYGMTLKQLEEAFKMMLDKGVEEFGLHAFLASNTVNEEYYPKLATILFNEAVKLKNLTGAKIKFINLSGGVGIPYTPDEIGRAHV